jgi:hypothetical protein
MRFSGHGSLPLWLFILIILLSAVSIAVVLFAVWRKCIKRKRERRHLLSDTSELPERKISIRRGHIIRASRKVSLTGPRFGEQSRPPSHQWPETFYLDRHHANVQKHGNPQSVHHTLGLEDDAANTPRRSWLDMFRGQGSTDEESRATPSIFDPVEHVYKLDSVHFQSNRSNPQPPVLDCPIVLSPITPLILPRTPRYPPVYPTNLQQFQKTEAVTSCPPKAYRKSRYHEEFGRGTDMKRRDSTRLNSRLLSCYLSIGSRSSAMTTESFLQVWSRAYCGWLSHPDSPLTSTPTKSNSTHVDVVSTDDWTTEASDESERPISLPSSRLLSSTGSISAISGTDSLETRSSHVAREQGGKALCKRARIRDVEISWLIDD